MDKRIERETKQKRSNHIEIERGKWREDHRKGREREVFGDGGRGVGGSCVIYAVVEMG